MGTPSLYLLHFYLQGLEIHLQLRKHKVLLRILSIMASPTTPELASG